MWVRFRYIGRPNDGSLAKPPDVTRDFIAWYVGRLFLLCALRFRERVSFKE